MNHIKKFRIKRGLKQKEIALKVGLSAPSISYYENGKKRPSINNAFKIAQALGVTVDELFNIDYEEVK